MEGLDNLKISEEKKTYIVQQLNPVLEQLVLDCMKHMPANVMTHMLAWLEARRASEEDAKLKPEEKVAIEKEVSEIRSMLEKAKQQLQDVAKMAAGEHEDEEEEEDDDDDCGDELPAHMLKPKGQTGARQSVSAEAYGEWNEKKAFVPPVNMKTGDQQARLKKTLQKSFMFSGIEEEDLQTVVNAMKELTCEPKDRPIMQGDDGDFLFVIESGSLDCLIKEKDKETGELTDKEICVKTCEAGDVFGELALLYNCPRAASVEAKEKCVLWQLDRETFNYIVKDAAIRKRETYDSFLSQVPLLMGMTVYERAQISDALVSVSHNPGDVVVEQGDQGNKFYIVAEGELTATKDGVELTDTKYAKGTYFGELALIRNQPRAATIKAKTAVKLLSLDSGSFKRLLAVNEILDRGIMAYS